MSMTKEVIKKFIEQDHKDDVILVTCDNEHKFFHNAYGNPPIIWDWANDRFLVLQTNQDIIDQNGHPFEITSVALEEIQFLTAYVDIATALKFINDNITNEEKKAEVKKLLQKVKPAMMAPTTLRKDLNGESYKKSLQELNPKVIKN